MQLIRVPTVILVLLLNGCGGGGGGGSGGGAGIPPVLLNQSPSASFEASGNPATSGELLQFDASGSTDPGGSVTGYEWDFGDGNTATGRIVNHVYGSLGDYQVTLRVNDIFGANDSTTSTVSVVAPFSVSGSISVDGLLRSDGDVNDINAPYLANDSFDQAQPLPNPARLIGYVSSTGTNSAGDRYASVADQLDFYSVELLAGQVVSVQVTGFDAQAPSAQDVDLFLYNPSRQLIASATGESAVKSFNAPSTGTWFVVVQGTSGINRYVLSIGNSSMAVNSQSLDFDTDEIIIAFKNGETATTTRDLLKNAWAARLKQGPAGHPARLQLGNQAARLKLLQKLRGKAATSVGEAELLSGKHYATLALLNRLRRQADVAYAEPNYRMYPHRAPNDSFYPLQWHYNAINLPAAWDTSTGFSNPDIIIAVADTGVLLNHPDLSPQLVPGYDFISDATIANDGDGIDDNPDDPGDEGLPDGRGSFHGTHVAGTVAAASDNLVGVAGVSWGARIMPLRVLGIGGGSSYDISQAMLFAAGLANDSGTVPPTKSDIINLSLGCTGCFSQMMQNTVNQVRAQGVIIVAAAGNESTNLSNYPAAYNGVVGVSATNSAGLKAGYSNFGSYVDIAAPGGDGADRNGDGQADRVISTWGDNSSQPISYGYAGSEGTSMASPHVAGVAALMKAIYPAMTPAEFDQVIANGDITNDAGAVGRDDDFGYGIVDAQRAAQTATNLAGGTVSGAVIALPNIINIPAGVSTSVFTLQPAGNSPPTVTGFSDDQTWLTAAAVGVDGSGYGTYQLTVDRTGLGQAVYQATVTISLSNGGELTIPVFMQVLGLTGEDGYAGFQYVLLIDTTTQHPRFQQSIDIDASGDYLFNFSAEVAPGEYLLYTGSDIDNDFLICQPGESCGAWPLLSEPAPIVVDQNTSGLDFEVLIETGFGTSSSQAQGVKAAPTISRQR